MCSENDVSVDTGMRVLGSELQVGPAGGVQSSAGREARWTGPQVLHKLTFTAGLGPPMWGLLPGVSLALPGQLPLQLPKQRSGLHLPRQWWP